MTLLRTRNDTHQPAWLTIWTSDVQPLQAFRKEGLPPDGSQVMKSSQSITYIHFMKMHKTDVAFITK